MLHVFIAAIALNVMTSRGTPSGDVPSVRRVFDISAATPVASPQQGAALPLIHSDLGDNFGPLSDFERNPESCLEVLRELQPDQWEAAEHSLELQQDGRLVVLAPPALQDSTQALLEYFASTFGRESRLVIDIATMKSANAASIPVLVPVADIARWSSTATAHETYEVAHLPGAAASMKAVRTLEIVRGYNSEIAERAVAFEAILDRVTAGLALECALTPAPGGSWLALSLQDVRQVGDIEDVELRQDARITVDSSIIPSRGPNRIQSVRLDEFVTALNTYVPDGQALVIHTTSDARKGLTRVLFVHPEGAPIGAISRPSDDVARALAPRDAAFVRTDAYALPRANVFNPLQGSSLTGLDGYGATDTIRYVTSVIEFQSSDSVTSMLRMDDKVNVVTTGAFAVLAAPDRATIDADLASVSPLLPEPRVLGVTFTLKRGSGGEVLAHAVVGMREGARSTVVLGQEKLFPTTTQLTVAQGAASMSTQMARAFEGMAVSVEPRATGGAGFRISIDAHARAARGEARTFDPGTASVSIVHQQDADLLDLQRAVTFTKDDKTPWRIVLGNSGPSADALTLEVEVVDLR